MAAAGFDQSDVTQRQGYLGGSDWRHVLGVEPYGCARRLCWEKRGTEPDYPEDVTPAMERGTDLEDAAARRYLKTEHATITRGRQPRGDVPGWWRGHVDRRVSHPERGRGILEIKTANGYVYRSLVKDGPDLGHVAQCHHYLGMTGHPWCDLWVCWPDGWEFRLWTIQRDEDLLRAMLEAGERFLRQVEHGPLPDRLDVKAKLCRRCPYRRSCQGEALLAAGEDDGEITRSDDPELLALIRQEREAADVAQEAEAVLDVVREQLRQAIWHLTAVEVPGYRVYFRSAKSRRIDTRALKAGDPEIAAKYEREIITRALRVYEI